jgi:hypothetical protein
MAPERPRPEDVLDAARPTPRYEDYWADRPRPDMTTAPDPNPYRRRLYFVAPSGRLHRLAACSGGPGAHRMRKARLTDAEARTWDGAQCRCLTVLRPSVMRVGP